MINLIKKVEGIIIGEVPYHETSKIINVLTKEDGLIGIVAKGAMRPKCPYMGLTSKLTYGYFHINYRDNLSSLIEVDLINSFKNIKKDLIKMSYSIYLTDLVNQVYKHEQNKEIYSNYIASLIKINEGFDPLVITNILELKMLDYLGIRPCIDKCVNCHNTSDIVTISSYRGGYLCKNWLNNEKIVNIKTIKLLRMFYYVDISKIEKLEISENIKKELNLFIDDYYDRYSGLYLKSKDFLNKIS